jgi:hypothetical protein
MRGPSRFALFTLSGLLGPGLVSCTDTCNSPTWTTPGPWDSQTLNAGSITLCPEFCVHFELNTVGASDDEYEGLMILDDSGWTGGSGSWIPGSSNDLSGKIVFWFGEGNAFGFGIQYETEWFTPALYSERKAYSVTFCLDTVSKAASIQVDDDVYTDPATSGRTWLEDDDDTSLWPDFPMTGSMHMLQTRKNCCDYGYLGIFEGTVTSMTVTAPGKPFPTPRPTSGPTPRPTPGPTPRPTPSPTATPGNPTAAPVFAPTPRPSFAPTTSPIPQPTLGALGGSDGAETRSITFYTPVAATVLYLVF